MKKILFIVVMVAGFSAYSQVGVGIANPDASAQLDVVSANKGMLIPRVKLTGTTDKVTIANAAVSLLVYNSTPASDVVAGFYYWNGTKWVALTAGGGSVSIADVTAAVAAETTRATGVEAGLQTAINTKATTEAITTAVATETTRATGVEAGLQTAIDTKASTTAITAAVAVETTRATGVETTLTNQIADKANLSDKVIVIDGSVNDTKYPSAKAVKTYVDATTSSFYGADGTLTASRTVNQDNKDLTFTTGTGKFNINGTTVQNGAVVGKFITTNNANYIVSADDNFILYSGTAVATFDCGTTSTAGRIITIFNPTQYSVNVTPKTGGYSVADVAGGYSLSWVFDGTGWCPLSQ